MRVSLLELSARTTGECLGLILEAAATRVPESQLARGLTAVSVANADGVEFAIWRDGTWAWCDAKVRPELELVAFFVTFCFGAERVTVVVDSAPW